MKSGEHFIGIDLGAESGRILIGDVGKGIIEIDEIFRFPIFPVSVGKHLFWDILNIWSNILLGMRRAVSTTNRRFDGIGIDSWALDFGLFDENDNLLSNPHSYRDPYTNGIVDHIQSLVSETELFQKTGLSYLNITTLGQLLTIKNSNPGLLSQAKTLLMLPNLLAFWLTGIKQTEVTIAGNTQLLNLHNRTWDLDLISRVGLPADILTKVIPSGTIVGNIQTDIEKETGLKNTPFIATACHDTASAVAAAPIESSEDAIISCGTWSVIGKEVTVPILSEQALKRGYHNIQCACSTYYFANYSIGLWLLQELKREIEQGGNKMDYATLTELAAKEKTFVAIINPDDSRFFHPGRITEKIKGFCIESHQQLPENIGSIARTILEGLALRYKNSIRDLELVSGKRIEKIHIIGGGSRNRLLCQFTADATQKIVIAGPAEATGAANILLQSMALGDIADLKQLRTIIRNSFQLETFLPGRVEAWDSADSIFSRYSHLKI